MAGSFETLSTRGLAESCAIERWTAFGSETLSDMSVDPDVTQPFEATLSRIEVADIGVVWMDTTAATARRRSSEVGSWAKGSEGAYLLTVQERGQSELDHNGREGMLLPGDMLLRSSGNPWSTRSCGRMSTVTLKLPAARVLSRLPDPEPCIGRVLGGRSAPVQMAASIMLSIKRSLADCPELSWSEAVADVVLDALALAYSREDDRSEDLWAVDPVRPLRWRDVCHFIDSRLDDPTLSVTAIASSVGMSVRSLQRMFVAEGVTASRFILDRRLERAADMLRDAAGRRNLTEMAFELGFNELSYFSRAFSHRFGMSPRAFQSMVRQ